MNTTDFKLREAPVIPLNNVPPDTHPNTTFSLRHIGRISAIRTKDTCHGEGLTTRLFFTFLLSQHNHVVKLEAVPREATDDALRCLEKVRSQMISHWNACYNEGEPHLYVSRDARWFMNEEATRDE